MVQTSFRGVEVVIPDKVIPDEEVVKPVFAVVAIEKSSIYSRFNVTVKREGRDTVNYELDNSMDLIGITDYLVTRVIADYLYLHYNMRSSDTMTVFGDEENAWKRSPVIGTLYTRMIDCNERRRELGATVVMDADSVQDGGDMFEMEVTKENIDGEELFILTWETLKLNFRKQYQEEFSSIESLVSWVVEAKNDRATITIRYSVEESPLNLFRNMKLNLLSYDISEDDEYYVLTLLPADGK